MHIQLQSVSAGGRTLPDTAGARKSQNNSKKGQICRCSGYLAWLMAFGQAVLSEDVKGELLQGQAPSALLFPPVEVQSVETMKSWLYTPEYSSAENPARHGPLLDKPAPHSSLDVECQEAEGAIHG